MTYKADDAMNLVNQLLIAMLGMIDDTFSGAVVYLYDHTENGALGLVINRSTDVDLASLLDKIDLQQEIQHVASESVYFGGPVQTDHSFVLHEQGSWPDYSSSLRVSDGLAITTSKDILEAVAADDGLQRFLMTLGYAGWSVAQLEDEIACSGWLNVSAPTDLMVEIICDTHDEYKYDKVLALLAIDSMFLLAQAGHA